MNLHWRHFRMIVYVTVAVVFFFLANATTDALQIGDIPNFRMNAVCK